MPISQMFNYKRAPQLHITGYVQRANLLVFQDNISISYAMIHLNEEEYPTPFFFQPSRDSVPLEARVITQKVG